MIGSCFKDLKHLFIDLWKGYKRTWELDRKINTWIGMVSCQMKREVIEDGCQDVTTFG